MSTFVKDFKQGLREGPLVFFAPLIAVARLVNGTANQLTRESERKHREHTHSERRRLARN